jgi:proteasome lid subunit RPN8/RPN11
MLIRQLWFTPNMHSALLEQARRAHPLEACGVLAGTVTQMQGQVQEIIPITNVAADPTVSYRLDDAELNRAADALHHAGREIIAFYHSHPNGAPIPSRADVLLAAHPHIPAVIIGQRGGVQVSAAWTIAGGEVEPLDSVIADVRPPAPPDFSAPQKLTAITVLLLSALLVLITALTLLPPAPEIPR